MARNVLATLLRRFVGAPVRRRGVTVAAGLRSEQGEAAARF